MEQSLIFNGKFIEKVVLAPGEFISNLTLQISFEIANNFWSNWLTIWLYLEFWEFSGYLTSNSRYLLQYDIVCCPTGGLSFTSQNTCLFTMSIYANLFVMILSQGPDISLQQNKALVR